MKTDSQTSQNRPTSRRLGYLPILGLVASFLFIAPPCFAVEVSAGLDFAMGSGSVDAGRNGAVQTLTVAPGARVGVVFARWFFTGVRSTYMQIEQTSEPTAVTGNRRGTWFMPVAPVIGLKLGRLQFFADYEATGDYKLALSNSAARGITYKNPSGFGVEALYALGRFFSVGVRYQKVDFGQEQVGSGSATSLDRKLALSVIGGVLSAHF